MITTKLILFQPMTLALCAPDCDDYKDYMAVGARHNWSPMAAELDWSTIDGYPEFYVQVEFVESIETRTNSMHPAYDGRRGYRRVTDGKRFCRTVCEVKRGRGSHTVHIENNGSVLVRVIPEDQVIPTVRLFVSAQFVRRGLDIHIDDYEQLSAFVVKDSVCLVIRPVGG